MKTSNIKTSGFSLAKGKELVGDDFYDVKNIDNLTIGIVCDGVGSAAEGAVAAKRVVTHIINNFKNRPKAWDIEKSIKTFITSINSILHQESIVNYERAELVTTLTIAVIVGDTLYGANVGDSRVYLLRENRLIQLSNDHSMNEVGYENVLTQAIGIDKEVDIYYFENKIQKGDKILLCSDGLYSIMSEDRLIKGIPLGAHSLVKKASALMDDNLPDDTTAVVINILEPDQVELLKQQVLEIPEKLKENDIIDGYRLKKPLIRNERTWLSEKNGINYVIKFAPTEAIEDKNILDLFVKEAWNAKRLKAGFFPKAVIPKIRSARYYVMEMIDGINLKTYLKKRSLSVDDTILLAKTLLKMGEYLLKFDLVHGDIKPENIMVIERDGKHLFKIIDFGSITDVYSLDSKAGTPSYISPERFKGASINETSEIFSIGVTLYESLTRKYPYGEIEPFQNPTFKKAKDPSTLNSKIPLWLNAIILKSISIDSERRFPNYSNMYYELENPNEVKPFFEKNVPLLQRDPVLFYKVGFYLMLIINFILLVKS